MSTVVEDHAAASAAPPTVSSIVARRDVLIALAIGGLLVAIGAGLLLATSDHLVDPIAFGLHVAVMVVGWFSAALYWLVRRPGNRLGLFLLALAVARPWCRFRERPSRSSAASVCWPIRLVCSSRVLRRLRVPGGSYCESLRMGDARRDGARTTGVVRPLAPLLAGRQWQCSVCRLRPLRVPRTAS